MRRLVVELSAREPANFPELSILERVKSLEMLHILKMSPGEFAAIVRVELKDPSTKIEDLFPSLGAAKLRTELLSQEKKGTYTYFISTKASHPSNLRKTGAVRPLPLGSFPYFFTPFEFRDGKLTLTFLGNSKQIRTALEALELHDTDASALQSGLAYGCAVPSELANHSLNRKATPNPHHGIQARILRCPQKNNLGRVGQEGQLGEINPLGSHKEGGTKIANRGVEGSLVPTSLATLPEVAGGCEVVVLALSHCSLTYLRA